MLLSSLGRIIRARRKELGWTRRNLAEHTAISERFLADIETGKANPSLLKLCELADALGATPQSLLASAAAVGVPQGPRVISLLGLRGAGKSTIGRVLAAQLGCEFVELDREVESQTGLTLAQIFELHGENYYRRTEREVLRGLLGQKRRTFVLATGGGLVTERETYDLLRSHTHTVWLRAKPEDHWSRVVAQGDTRPMANDAQAFSAMCSMLTERERLYQQAELTLETTNCPVQDISTKLADQFAHLQAS